MKYVIIAGSEKSGTTSLYQYLADSGLFANSIVKETDYFRQTTAVSENEYKQKYYRPNPGNNVYLEGSPGYLSDSYIAAKNIASTLSNYQLIFCLRNPLDRLKSSFLFHKSRLYIPENMNFDHYVSLCMKYERGELSQFPIGEWFLRVPDCGKYFKHLSDFVDACGRDTLKIIAFDELKNNPRSVVNSVLSVADIQTNFYDSYEFGQSNVTFAYKNKLFQRAALFLNHSLESVWLRCPKIKARLLSLYQHFNGKGKEKTIVSDKTKAMLFDFYRDDIKELARAGFISELTATAWLADMSPKYD